MATPWETGQNQNFLGIKMPVFIVLKIDQIVKKYPSLASLLYLMSDKQTTMQWRTLEKSGLQLNVELKLIRTSNTMEKEEKAFNRHIPWVIEN
ncbi:Protein of unknown function [Gryllus bimaculatus]|nr:Protein of unknown function [Gryllus bimaculatus]